MSLLTGNNNRNGSENAKAVAMDVVNHIRNHKKVKMGEILKNRGYSPSVQKAPTIVTRSKAYIEAIKPLLPQLDREQQRFISAIGKKNLDREKLPVLISGFDILTKNKQLISGKATENIAIRIEISEALAAKYAQKDDTQTANPSSEQTTQNKEAVK